MEIEQRIVEGRRKRGNKKDFTLNRRKAREEEGGGIKGGNDVRKSVKEEKDLR